MPHSPANSLIKFESTSVAIYPGRFDPVTHGHADIMRRAARLFARLIIAVAGPAPTSLQQMTGAYCFKQEERIRLIKQVINSLDLGQNAKIEVLPLEGLLVDFAERHQVNTIVRGIRPEIGQSREFQMANINRTLQPALDTVFLVASPQYASLSASLVREIAGLGGDVGPFVHPVVKQALITRFEQGNKS